MTEAAEQQNSIQDKVNSICNDLYSEGTKPTVRRVLAMLPDVSSTSTVHKYFANWKKEIEANQQSLYDRLGFSSEFTQSFMKEITRFGVEAEQRYKQQATDANDQRDQALYDLEQSEEKLFKQNAVVEQLEKEVSELQKELAKVRTESKAELDKQHDLSRVNSEKERESHDAIAAELRGQITRLSDSNSALTESNEKLRTDVAKANLKLEGNEAYVGEIKEQNAGLTEGAKTLSAEIAKLNKQLAGQEATLSGNEKLIKNLQGQLERVEKANDLAERDNIKLSEKLDVAGKDIESISTQLRAFEQTEKSNAATIAGNEKLIAQLEKMLKQAEVANANQDSDSGS